MESQDWAVVFLIAGILLAVAELAAPGLVLLPFGLGAICAAVVGFLGGEPVVQGIVFVVASTGFFFALRPLGRKLNESDSDKGIGVKRMNGAAGVVLQAITANETGMVRVDREEWRAESANGQAIPAGSEVQVVEVKGTRVVVIATRLAPTPPPMNPPLGGEPK
jgi:membrane protein implicated in regulation of membrane protease activity